MSIDYRQDKTDAMKAVVDPKQLTDKVEQLKNLEDEIANAEAGVKKLKEQANVISQFEIPQMMKDMNITKLKLKDGQTVEVGNFYSASILPENRKRLLNGFVKTVEVILLKMILPLPLVVAKITRRHNMLSLHKVKDTNLSRK